MMKKYWLLLESYVFVWKNTDKILFYNTLSGKDLMVDSNGVINQLMNNLLSETNHYCIELTEDDIKEPEISSLIHLLRNRYMADLYEQSLCPQKPLVITPSVSMNEDFDRTLDNSNNIELFGQKVLKNLQTVSIQITGKCHSDCSCCNSLFRQTTWCTKGEGELSFQKLCGMLEQVEQSHVPYVNLLGGNILEYSCWTELVSMLKSCSFQKVLYLNIDSIDDNSVLNKMSLDSSFHVRFCINPDFNEDKIKQSLNFNVENSEYVFAVTSVEDFECANGIIDKYDLKASVLPYYTSNNLSFFEGYVFSDLEDIRNLRRTKKEIFANQKINTNYFGHLFISHTGSVYSNINFSPIGTIEDKLSKLVFTEMKESKVWHKTRENLPVCKDCLYKYLCQSPSNYELAIGRNNLCHINS